MSDPEPEFLVIPHASLSPAALQGVLEAFVLREGTDYGMHEYTLEQKVEHVRQQLERGDAEVVFDVRSTTVDIRRTAARRRTGADDTAD